MSDRFIIEISTTQTVAGVAHTEKVGDLILTTTDPVAAVEFRKSLRSMLANTGYDLKLVEESTERRGVITAFNEDHFRVKASADREAGAAAGFDREMNEQGAAWKTLTRLDNYLSGDAGEPSAREYQDIALTLDHYDIGSAVGRELVRQCRATPDLLRDLLLALSTVCRGFETPYRDAVDTGRWIETCRLLAQHNPNSITAPDVKACEREALLDYKACEGRVIEVRFVNGFDLGTTDQNDHVAGTDEPPYRVIVTAMDPIQTQWTDDDLDPKWDVRPAADETRLDGLRSLWTFGRSYKTPTAAKTEG